MPTEIKITKEVKDCTKFHDSMYINFSTLKNIKLTALTTPISFVIPVLLMKDPPMKQLLPV